MAAVWWGGVRPGDSYGTNHRSMQCLLSGLFGLSSFFQLSNLTLWFHWTKVSLYHWIFSLSTSWWSWSAWPGVFHSSTSSTDCLCFSPGNKERNYCFSEQALTPTCPTWRDEQNIYISPLSFAQVVCGGYSLRWPLESPGVHTSLVCRFPSSPEDTGTLISVMETTRVRTAHLVS